MLRNDADARRCSYFGLGLPVVLRDLIFGIRIDWFLFLGTNFCDFQKVNINNIFVFIEYLQQNYIVLFSNNTTVCVPYVKPHRRTGNFLPGGAVIHLPKKFLQVAQIFTKQSKGN